MVQIESRDLRRYIAEVVPDDEAVCGSLCAALSDGRLNSYLVRCGNDRRLALAAYTLNVQLCQAFLLPVSYCEIALRSTISRALAAWYGERWPWNQALIKAMDLEFQELLVNKAMPGPGDSKDGPDGNSNLTAAEVAAEMKFSFWKPFLHTDFHYLFLNDPRKGTSPGTSGQRAEEEKRLALFFPGLTKEVFPGGSPRERLISMWGAVGYLVILRNRILHQKGILFRRGPHNWLRLCQRVLVACSPRAADYMSNQQEVWRLIVIRRKLLSVLRGLQKKPIGGEMLGELVPLKHEEAKVVRPMMEEID